MTWRVELSTTSRSSKSCFSVEEVWRLPRSIDVVLEVETAVLAHKEATIQVAQKIGGRVLITRTGRAIMH